MLAGRIFRSPYSHGEIVAVDVAEAARLPGVKAIVTGADCDKTFGVLPIARSEYPLARDRVRYRGEPVAAVAAIDDATALQGAAADQARRSASCRPITLRAPRRRPAPLCTSAGPTISSAMCSSSSAMPSVGFAAADLVREAPRTAPRSARTRWRCTPRSRNTTRSATA